MMRFVENFINGSLFYDLAGVHNGNPVAHRSDNAEVVGNHDNRGSFFLRQLFQKLQNLCLYGHIQCGCRLICDNQLRVTRQSRRNDDSLPHTAGKFERILIEPFFRTWNSNLPHQLNGFRFRLFFGAILMLSNSLCHLNSDFQDRIQKCHRILENHADAVSADLLHFLFISPFFFPVLRVRRRNVFSVEKDLSFFHSAVRCQKPHQGQHADTFSGTGLADNTKYLALFQMIGNIADCADGSLLRFKFCCEMADFE